MHYLPQQQKTQKNTHTHHLFFWILCATSCVVPPSLVTLLPRHTKLSTSSILSSPSINDSLLFVFTLKALVFFTLIASPTYPTSFFRSSSFACISPCASDNKHKSSAKSRPSNLSTRPHLSKWCFCTTLPSMEKQQYFY
jgi:hypothetical protein